jgi:formylglycine-generating enzyme
MTRPLVLSSLLVAALSNCALADTFGSGANTFNIDFVTIGNPGNAADTTGNPNPAGKVLYAFRVGKFEISEQMIDKANTLGGLGITKDTRSADQPATDVTWNEAARFVNWLDTSSGSPPAYKFALQPGDSGYDPNADIELWMPSDAGYNPINLYRNTQARYVLPTDEEWYKAAYYDPTTGVYYDYPTGSNVEPTAVASGTAAGTAVYHGSTGPVSVMLAGGLSRYGTMGQGGNVFEWEESASDLVPSARVVRGRAWGSVSSSLSSSVRGYDFPNTEDFGIGFRVASAAIPEPSTILLAVVAFAALPTRRRKSVPQDRV